MSGYTGTRNILYGAGVGDLNDIKVMAALLNRRASDPIAKKAAKCGLGELRKMDQSTFDARRSFERKKEKVWRLVQDAVGEGAVWHALDAADSVMR